MRLCFFISILSLFTGCSRKIFIAKEMNVSFSSQITRDSIRVLPPAFSFWRFSGNRDFNHPAERRSRPDSVIKYLNENLNKKNISVDKSGKVGASCIETKINSSNLSETNTLDIANYNCLKLDPDFYSVVFYFSMDVTEAGYGIASENSLIEAFVIVLNKQKIVFHRQYLNTKGAKKSDFPSGSTDRKEYPYFSNKQIKDVTDKITRDLLNSITD